MTENKTTKGACLGVLPDGTPVEDMLEELKETKAREADLRALLQTIRFHAQAKSSEAGKALKAIREITANAR
jgi:hypothetical protein